MMKIDVLSLFPDMFSNVFNASIMKKAQDNQAVSFGVTDFRAFTENKHNKVDDYPFGGGAGMVLMPQPIFSAVDHLTKKTEDKPRVIMMTPQGKTFNQSVAESLSKEKHLIFLCGHYEGFDERVREALVTDELSLGDYVLTGGELASMVMIDSIVRLLPGVLGNHESAVTDSFSHGLLEHPHYTRPRDFAGRGVPDVLLSGDHAKVEEWRHRESLRRTYERRPDLLANREMNDQEKAWIQEFRREED